MHSWYIPLNTQTQKLHRDCVKKILQLNTLLVLPDDFVRANISAILAYNFYKIFPGCSVFFLLNSDVELPNFLIACSSAGIPQNRVKNVSDKKKNNLVPGGVFIMTPKAFVTSLTCGALSSHNIKLIVINEANKAYGHSALSRLVSLVMNEGANVRVLGLAETLPIKKVATLQSIISNLCVSSVLIKNYSDGSELNKVLYPYGVKVQRIKFIKNNITFADHLKTWKEGISQFTKKLAVAELITESDPDGLIFSENWRKLLESANEEWKAVIRITSSLVAAYRILALYGYRAFYLCLKSKIQRHSQLLNTVSSNAELKYVYEFAEKDYSFSDSPIPSTELFELMKASHPKMPKVIDVLEQYLPAKTDDYKLIIFCESCFGARAVVELLSAQNIYTFKENWSELEDLVAEECCMGRVIEDKRWVINKFKSSDISILVSSSFVDNLSAHEIFDCAIGMDYCTASLRYMKYGGKARHCLLMDEYESLPSNAFCCDWLQAKHLFCNESLYRFEKSMNPFQDLGKMSEIPVEYVPLNFTPEDEGKKNVARSVKESSEEPREIAELDAIALTNVQKKELEDYGIEASWDWKISGRGIKDCFTYETDTIPELCCHPPLASLDNWCSHASSMKGNYEFFNKLLQHFRCVEPVGQLEKNEKEEPIDDGKISLSKSNLGTILVKKRKKCDPSTLNDAKKPKKKAKKVANYVEDKEENHRQVITDHFEVIRPLSTNDFRDPVAELSIAREKTLLRILNMCGTMS